MFSVETRIAFILFWGKMYFLSVPASIDYRDRQIKLKTAQIFGVSTTMLSIFRLAFFVLLALLLYLSLLVGNWIKSIYPSNIKIMFLTALVMVTFLSFFAIFSPVYFKRMLAYFGLIRSSINYLTLKRLYDIN